MKTDFIEIRAKYEISQIVTVEKFKTPAD